MHPRDQDPFDPTRQLYEAIEDLDRFVTSVQTPEAVAAGGALERLVQAILVLFSRPAHLDVGEQHQTAAVALASAFLDEADGHRLLVETLHEYDQRAMVDPEFRIGLFAALGQLVGDSLIAAVAAWIGETGEEIGDGDVREACRTLLQRIALARTQQAT